MSPSESRDESERIESSKAKGLCRVLALSLENDATALSHAAARDVARLMRLPGLEQVIAASARHPAHRRPRELVHVLERVQRLMSAAESRGTIAPFVEADAELLTLANDLAAAVWGPAEAVMAPPLATVSLDEALGGRPADHAAAREATLRASVAAAVRAACDWLSPDASEGVRIERHDDSLVIGLRLRQHEHLDAAGEVIGEAGGSLGPSPRHDGTWDLRVPVHVARPTFLLVEQRGVGLALPWHAVLRLRMTAREAALEEAPVLSLLEGPAAAGDERPAALIAHGLRRAWVFADRVVWRLAATPEPADSAPPIAESTQFVRDADDRHWWILEPRTLLRDVPAPVQVPDARGGRDARGIVTEVVAVPGSRERAAATARIDSPPPLRVMPSRACAPVSHGDREAREPSVHEAPTATARPAPVPIALGPADVEPLDRAPVDLAPPQAPGTDSGGVPEQAIAIPEAPPAPEADREAARPAPIDPAHPGARAIAHGRRVLVAEDSIVASIFLQRLLTQRGFDVLPVDRCDLLLAVIAQPDWVAVFVDVRLPDSPAGRHLRAVAEHRVALAHPFALVALTADASDDALARDSGISHTLRKPFESEALDRRLAALGLGAGESV